MFLILSFERDSFAKFYEKNTQQKNIYSQSFIME